MKRWLLIGIALVLLAVLLGGVATPGCFPQSTASINQQTARQASI
jgi:hypothetical protein